MKRLRKIIFWFLGTILALFIALSAIVYFVILRDENQIKNIVVNELNKSLTGKIEVEEMKFTFWSSFPYIALDFRKVLAMGANPNDSTPLLKTERLSLNFNLRDMLAKKYEVKKIDINNAVVCIKRYADGSANYNLWKSNDTSSSNFSFALKKIQFKNTQLNFLDERSEQRYEMYFYRCDAKGDFSESAQNISLSGDLLLELWQSGKQIIFTKKRVNLQTQFLVDHTSETIRFSEGLIRFEKLNLDWKGSLNYSDDVPYMDFSMIGKKLNLQEIFRQIPTQYAEKIKDYPNKGELDFQFHLSGNYHQSDTWKLEIPDFSARLESGQFSGNFAMTNFQSPALLLNCTFNADLKELSEFFSIAQIEQISGKSKGRLQYQHRFKSLDFMQISEVLEGQLQAEISCKNVLLKLQDSLLKSPIRLDTARFELSQNHLKIPFLKGEFEKNKFQTSLFFYHFLNTLQTPRQMRVSGDLKMDKIQIDSILLQDLQTSLRFENEILSLENFSTKVWNGNIHGDAEINCSDTARLPFRVNGSLAKINAEKLFADFHNFDQNEITDKNLKGLIDANFTATGIYLPGKGLDTKSLWITMKTKVSNGELKDVAILQKLSRFVDEKTLSHVKFATLENTIEIKDEIITLPEMKIRSNALNINVSGTQHWDGKIDYSVKIALSELLSKRRRERRKNQEETGVVEDEKKRASLFVHITGTTENPHFRFDIQNVFKKLELGADKAAATIKKEHETVKNILKDEFQFLQKSEETKQREALWREQEKGKFVIEWDENKADSLPYPAPVKKSVKKDTVRIGVVFEDE